MQSNGNPLAGQIAASLDQMVPSPELASILSPGPSYDPLSAPIPAFMPPAPPPAAPRTPSAASLVAGAEKRQAELASGSLRKFGLIAQKFPGADKVRIRKVEDNGTSGPCGEWSFRDATQYGDIEAFCLTHIAPKYGPGTYSVDIFDGRGTALEAGRVYIPRPLAPAAPSVIGNNDIAMRLLDEVRSLRAPAPPPVDPITQYRQMQSQIEEIKKASGGDSMMLMMLMMQQQQQNAVPRGPDPAMMELIGMMRSEIASLKQAATAPAPMAMPPMGPPPENPLLTALAPALPMLLERMVSPKPDPNALTLRDVIELVKPQAPPAPPKDPVHEFRESMRFFKEMQGNQPQESIKDKLAEIAAIKELASEISGGGGGAPSGTTFWDALGALFSNKSFGDNLGAAIGQEVKARQVQLTGGRQNPALPANTRPQTQSQPAAPAQPQQTAQPRIVVPEDMRDHCAKMEGADDDGDRAQATIAALASLQPHPQWRPFIQSLLEKVANGEKKAALMGLGNWLKLLVDGKLLDEKAALRVLKTFDTQWDIIHLGVRARLGMPAPAANGPAAPSVPTPTKDPILTPPPVDAAPVAPMPAVEPPAPPAPPPPPDGDGEEDEEVDENDEDE